MIDLFNRVLFDIKCHAALDRNLGPRYNTLLSRLIQRDLHSACPHRQFNTLPGHLQSGCTAKTPTKAMHAKQGDSLYHFYDGLWYDLTRA